MLEGLNRPTTESVHSQWGVVNQRSYMFVFIELPDLSAHHRFFIPARSIAVVNERKEIGTDRLEAGVVLIGEPRVRVFGFGFEVTILAQFPEHVTASLPVFPVDLQDPVLLRLRKNQVARRRHVGNGVGVSPPIRFVRKQDCRTATSTSSALGIVKRLAMEVEVIEPI